MTGVCGLRVCVCTSYPADAEPRAPRHASALANLSPDIEVIFIDCAPIGQPSRKLTMIEEQPNLTWRTHFYQHRNGTLWRLIFHRLRKIMGQWVFRVFGTQWPCALSSNVIGLESMLDETVADVYLAHNIDTLLPVAHVAEKRGLKLIFDCMEFYSDMGDAQSALDRRIIRAIEAKCLPRCALVLASSDQVADEYARIYNIPRPTPLYNVPPVEHSLESTRGKQFQLYWRNSVIGIGQRGLEEALMALRLLPNDITLHLQGKLPDDGRSVLSTRIDELGITDRVVIHPPYLPEDAVKVASKHTVGLCLERAVNRNHDLTVSNKIFDYMMAGLAVVASDLPGLSSVIDRSGGGVIFKAGSARDLAEKIMQLYNDRGLLYQLQAKAREFALQVGNREKEMKRFTEAFLKACSLKPATYPDKYAVIIF